MQRDEVGGAPPNAFDPAVDSALGHAGAGEPVPAEIAVQIEQDQSVDLSRVRFHHDSAADSAARALSARAFTVGEDVYFARGAFSPGDERGRALLAHELTHVLQHQQGRISPADGRSLSSPSDNLEREAHAATTFADLGRTASAFAARPSASPATRIHRAPGEGEPPKDGDAQNKIGAGTIGGALPEGTNIDAQFPITTIRVKWLKEQGFDTSAPNPKLPAEVAKLIYQAARAKVFHWATDELIAARAAASCIVISAVGDAEFIKVEIPVRWMLEAFGLPPGASIFWVVADDGSAMVTVSAEEFGKFAGVKDGDTVAVTDAKLTKQILNALPADLPWQGGEIDAFTLVGRLGMRAAVKSFTREEMLTLVHKEDLDDFLTARASKQGNKQGNGQQGNQQPEGGQQPQGGQKPAPPVAPASLSPKDQAALAKLRKVFDFLKANYPEEFKDKTFEDFIAYLKAQPAPTGPTDGEELDLKDPKKWKQVVACFVDDKPLVDNKPVLFTPSGQLLIHPETADREYPLGAELTAEPSLAPGYSDIINAHAADYSWKVDFTKAKNAQGVAGEGDAFEESRDPSAINLTGDYLHKVKLKKPGTFVISVTANNEHFNAPLNLSRTVTAVDPNSRLDALFDQDINGGKTPFMVGPDGKLQLRPNAVAQSFDAQKKALMDQMDAIEALVKAGKVKESDGAEALSLMRDRLRELSVLDRESGTNKLPYVVTATYVSTEAGNSFPLRLTVYGSAEQKDGAFSYTILIADTSSLESTPRYEGTSKAVITGDEGAARRAAELDAINAACAAFKASTDYPDGLIKMALKLHETDEVHTFTFDTKNGRKKAKKYAGYAGMALGSVGLAAGVVFTEGATTPVWVKVIMISAAAAGVIQAGVSIEQRIKNGTFGSNVYEEAVDISQVVVGIASLGASAWASAPGGFQTALTIGDKAQMVFIGAKTKDAIDKANGKYAADIANGVPPETAAKERDNAISQEIMGAIQNAAFVVFAHASGEHGGAGESKGVVPDEHIAPELRKLAYERPIEEVKAKLDDASLKADEKRFLHDMIDYRLNHPGEQHAAPAGEAKQGSHEAPAANKEEGGKGANEPNQEGHEAPAGSREAAANKDENSKNPTGAVRGKETYQLDNVRQVGQNPDGTPILDGNLGPSRLHGRLKEMVGAARRGKATFEVKGKPEKVTNGAETVTVVKCELRVPDGAGGETVVDVTVRSTSNLSEPTSHAGEAGPARLDIQPPDTANGKANWKAAIEVNNHLREEDVKFTVGHELDEAAEMVQRGLTDPADRAAQHEAALFSPTATELDPSKATAHDVAHVSELNALVSDVEPRLDRLRGMEGSGATPPPELVNQVNERMQRLQSSLKAMGISDPERFAARKPALKKLGLPEAQLDALQTMAEHKAYVAKAGGQANTRVTEKLVSHLLHPEAQSGFAERGLYGGHQTANLLEFCETNKKYAVVELSKWSGAGTTLHEFAQYQYIGPGEAPTDAKVRPNGVDFHEPNQDWQRANVVKTTADQTQPYLHDAEAAFESWRQANFTPGPPPSGRAIGTGGKGEAPCTGASNTNFTVPFTFEAGPPPSWSLITIFATK